MSMKVVGLDEKRVELVHKYRWPGLLAVVVTAAIIAAIVCAIVIPDWDDDETAYDSLFHHRHHHHEQQLEQQKAQQQADDNHKLADAVIAAVQRMDVAKDQGRGAGDGPINGRDDDEELVEEKVIESKEIVEDINVNVNVNVTQNKPVIVGGQVSKSEPSKPLKTLEDEAHVERSQKEEVELLPIPSDDEVRAALAGLAIPGDYEEVAAEPIFRLRPFDTSARVFGPVPFPQGPRQMARFYPGRTRVLSDPERVDIERMLHPIPRNIDDVMINPLLMRSAMDPFGLFPDPEFGYQDESIDFRGPDIGHPPFMGQLSPFPGEPALRPPPKKDSVDSELKTIIDNFEKVFGPIGESDTNHGGMSVTMLSGHMSMPTMSDAEFERVLNEADKELAKLARLQQESKEMMDDIGAMVKHEREDERLLQAKMTIKDPNVLQTIPKEITIDHVMAEERVAEGKS